MAGCTVEVNGTSYYAPCDRIEYIEEIDGYLINTGSSSITLYIGFPTYSDNTSGYPRIVLPTNTKGYLRQSYNSQTYQTVSVSSYKVTQAHTQSSSIYSILILGVLLCLFLKR